MLLYTDGLVERRDQLLDDGLERLRETLEDLAGQDLDSLCDELLHRLGHVEATVRKMVVPPAYGDLLYDLRGHIAVVRANLAARRPVG